MAAQIKYRLTLYYIAVIVTINLILRLCGVG